MPHGAKEMVGDAARRDGADADTCLRLEKETASIAAYGDALFGVRLSNALSNLFTFVRYPEMPSAGNGSERDIRDTVVKQRKFRHKFAGAQGVWAFFVIHRFVRVCRKMDVPSGGTFKCVATRPGGDLMPHGLCTPSPADPTRGLIQTAGTLQVGRGALLWPNPALGGRAARSTYRPLHQSWHAACPEASRQRPASCGHTSRHRTRPGWIAA